MVGDEAETLNPLFGPKVKALLADLPRSAAPLEVAKRTRREFDADLARRVAELHSLRNRAADKFGPELPFYFTRKGVEQASPYFVADYRASVIRERAGLCELLDATCGVGADSLAFARAGLPTISSDLDHFLLQCTRENLREAGFEPRMVLADAARPAVRADQYFVDPDRRADGNRTSNPERWSPSLARALEAARRFRGAAVKLPPALDPEDDGLPTDASLSWISKDRRLYEVTLWLGNLAGEQRREAVLLQADGGAERWSAQPELCPPLRSDDARSIRWIAEADPAVLRAGLLGNWSLELGFAPLAPKLAYLGGMERPGTSPFGRVWPVLGVASVHPRPVRALLAEHDIGPLTVKKRGHPDDAETLAKRLRGKGKQRGLLFVARLEDGHAAYLAGPPT